MNHFWLLVTIVEEVRERVRENWFITNNITKITWFINQMELIKYIFLKKTVKSNFGKNLKIGQKSEKIAFF